MYISLGVYVYISKCRAVCVYIYTRGRVGQCMYISRDVYIHVVESCPSTQCRAVYVYISRRVCIISRCRQCIYIYTWSSRAVYVYISRYIYT